MFVYVIVNDLNWKIYIGKTTRPNLRQYLQQKVYEANHYISRRSHLYAAIRKYGREHFHIYPLISGLQTNDELSHWERVLIKALAARNPEVGYNICQGGEGFTGQHSPETRQKISAASREMWQRPETRKSIVSKMEGRPVSPKVIAMLQARRGTKASPQTIEKLRNSHIGLVRSEASRKKQSLSVTGAGNHFYGKTHSESAMAGRWRAVRCIDTDEVFPSLRHVVERFGGSQSNIVRSIKKGHKFLGKQFEYVQ